MGCTHHSLPRQKACHAAVADCVVVYPQSDVKGKGISCWSMRQALAGRQSTPLVKLVRKPGPQTVSWHVAGSSSAAVAPAVSLPPEDANRVTGEEEERSVYTGEPPRPPQRTQLSLQHWHTCI